MCAVRDENFYVVHGWMINRLHLKGNELKLYAIIYGFSQTAGQEFNGSLQYLSDWLNSTRPSVKRCLLSLQEKGLLTKEDVFTNGVKTCKYRCIPFGNGVTEMITGCSQNDNGVLSKRERGCSQNDNGGVVKMGTNNIPDNIPDIHNENNVGDKTPTTPPEKRTRFVPPTVEEVDAYCRERGNHVDAQRFYDYYAASGWKRGKTPIKDWRACVRTWERSEIRPQPQRAQDDRKRIKTAQEHSAGQHASGFGWGD